MVLTALIKPGKCKQRNRGIKKEKVTYGSVVKSVGEARTGEQEKTLYRICVTGRMMVLLT